MMPSNRPGRILVCVEDLLFVSRIRSAVKSAGLTARFAKADTEAIRLAMIDTKPDLVLLDLGLAGAEIMEVIRLIRSHVAGARLVAFAPHVQMGLKREALEAGCDEVLSRSEFSDRLVAVLRGAGSQSAGKSK